MTSKLAKLFLIFVLVIPIVRAQSGSREASAAEEKKAREDRDKKTLALVDEIIKEAQSLKLPENRIRIDIALAQSLWSRDETRARALFKDAGASLSEITAAIDSGDREYSNLAQLPQQLRLEILQVAASHDPKLALDFLRATRPASVQPSDYGPNFDAQLEMRLAVQVAAKDPAEALRIGEESLKNGIDQETMNLLYQLQSRDKAAAEKFLGDILNRLRTEDFSKSPASAYIALNLLRTWIENNRSRPDQAAPRTVPSIPLTNLDQQTARELSDILINVALNTGPPGALAYRSYPGDGILQQLKPMISEIESLSPGRVAALRQRIAEFDKLNEAQQGPWAKYQELIQNGAAEALMEASKTAPPEFANQLVQQAAWKAFNQGDLETARQIVENISDPRQRAEMALNLDRQSFYRARDRQKLAEARALLARIPSVEEQARLLAELATSATTKGDKSTALQLLGEAQGLIGYRALSYAQLGAQLRIASAYEQLDAGNSAAIVQRVIDQLNELSGAALVLNGFDLHQYFREGEFVINGGNPMNITALQSAQELGSIARNDLDGAKSMAGLFQRPEMRVMALLQIAQVVLSDGRSTSAQASPSGVRFEPGNRVFVQPLIRPMSRPLVR